MDHFYLSRCYALCSLLLICLTAASPATQHQPPAIRPRASACSSIVIVSGDTCGTLATKCGISTSQFTALNPEPSLCSSLLPGNSVCCSDGSISTSSSQSGSSGDICNTYAIMPGDYCSQIASNHGISVADLETWNSQTWDWSGCDGLQPEKLICVSAGQPPMPAAIPGAVCGPQVPGTQRPTNGASLNSLNPCPPSQCCSQYGQCGNTPEFCPLSALKSFVQVVENAATKSTVQTTHVTSEQSSTSAPTTTSTHSTESRIPTSTSTTHTTSAAPTPSSDPWLIKIYGKEDCKGAHYVVQGYNDHTTGDCTNLHGGLSPTPSADKASCRWFSGDDETEGTSCDESSLKTPQSWSVELGLCTAYETDQCKAGGNSQLYSSYTNKGCENVKDSKFNTKTWAALKCSVHN